jgi:hypothetical protein
MFLVVPETIIGGFIVVDLIIVTSHPCNAIK